MERKKVYFVSGIDTDAGKSYAAGYIASLWHSQGVSVITQKLIQTGWTGGVSEDIAVHRRIMGTGLLPEDTDGITCPLCFSYPASPDLAARMEGREIDLVMADRSTQKLLMRYDTVIIEGAGGLMVPIRGLYTMLDYIIERSLPVILVTNPRLGSINHTLLSLEACRTRGAEVSILAYNLCHETSPEITADSRIFLMNYLSEYFPSCEYMEIPFMAGN